MNTDESKRYRMLRKLGWKAERALRVAKGGDEFRQEERDHRQDVLRCRYDGVPPYDPEDLMKARVSPPERFRIEAMVEMRKLREKLL